jgi:hypothetical protein
VRGNPTTYYGGTAERGYRRTILGFGFLVLLMVGGVALALALGGAGWLRRTGTHRVHPTSSVNPRRVSCWTGGWHGERSIKTSTRRFAPPRMLEKGLRWRERR